MRKYRPTVLVVNTTIETSQIPAKKYNFIFHAPDSKKSPFDQASDILYMLKKKNIVIDGVVGFNDVASVLSAILAERMNLPGPSVRSIYRAQNKAIFYKFLEKAKLPFPPTRIIDITKPIPKLRMFPKFVKPIRSNYSSNSFILRSQDEFMGRTNTLLTDVAKDHLYFTPFFEQFNKKYLPIANWYILQQFVKARQFTLDAFVFQKKLYPLAFTRSIYTADRTSFKRFDFPSRLSSSIHSRVINVAQQIVDTLGFDNAGCNIEFFITKDERIYIIGCNTRISHQFVPMMEQMYELSPITMMIDLALGKMPVLTQKNEAILASSFPLRVRSDCLVRRVPTSEEVLKLKRAYDLLTLNIFVRKGSLLSHYPQDSYSYCFGYVDVLGKSRREIMYKYRTLMQKLPLILEPIG